MAAATSCRSHRRHDPRRQLRRHAARGSRRDGLDPQPLRERRHRWSRIDRRSPDRSKSWWCSACSAASQSSCSMSLSPGDGTALGLGVIKSTGTGVGEGAVRVADRSAATGWAAAINPPALAVAARAATVMTIRRGDTVRSRSRWNMRVSWCLRLARETPHTRRVAISGRRHRIEGSRRTLPARISRAEPQACGASMRPPGNNSATRNVAAITPAMM